MQLITRPPALDRKQPKLPPPILLKGPDPQAGEQLLLGRHRKGERQAPPRERGLSRWLGRSRRC